MYSQAMYELGSRRSVIREIFEYGRARAAAIGADKVFDFSLGNPSVPPPDSIDDTIRELLATAEATLLHGYSSAPGDSGVRAAMAQHLNARFDTAYRADNLYITTGAAAALCICFTALTVPGDEYIAFAPYFPEYQVFVEAAGGKLMVVVPRAGDFQIEPERLAAAVTPHTKAVIINSPNNPSGVVYSEATVSALAAVLKEKSRQYGHPIYLIADEPYRELVYDDVAVPWLPAYYDDTLVCYSYSKSLSLPGERIGYVLIPDAVTDSRGLYAAAAGAARALGYVCAPSLFQQVVARNLGLTADIAAYKRNRDLLTAGLRELGYSYIKPDGAFYLFMRSPEPDANAFCARARGHELLLVPGDDFGCPGYVRIAYCVTEKQITAAMPAFAALAAEYGLQA
ncbi:MAG: pyridoxal phosphate-dependent aminotransferase [Syntrophomonadaceae bacterium]|nr:pyridoxal phosphate-dependent aminotransferase [Syntrophomonadaceae bacterium]